jgi:FlaA1/EpsC-like NDP-sugar epimerase
MRIYGVGVLGTCKDFSKLIEKYDIGVIVLTDLKNTTTEIQAIVDQCKTTAVRFVVIPDIFETLNAGILNPKGGLPMEIDGKDVGSNPNCAHCLARISMFETNGQYKQS